MTSKLTAHQSNYAPVFLIGAARSGTKLVRDFISEHPEVDKVPYDINYIWRFGNESIDHDELQPDNLNNGAREKIVKHVGNFHKGGELLLEKTVSNCLRVPFVQSAFPRARFIFLVRDGYDVAESVFRQWHAPPDWRYIAQKARTFPLLSAPRYAVNYGSRLLQQAFTKTSEDSSSKPSIWGPAYRGIHDDMATSTLIKVCGLQWKRCIELSMGSFQNIDPENRYLIQYEEFVKSPIDVVTKLSGWLDVDPRPYHSSARLSTISTSNIGKGRVRLTKQQIEQIEPAISSGQESVEFALNPTGK